MKVTDNIIEVLESLIEDVKAINESWLKLLQSIPDKIGAGSGDKAPDWDV